MSEILKDFAVKALNLTDEQFAEIVYSDAEHTTVKDNAIQELLRLDAERVKTLKAANKVELTEKYNSGHQKGLAEGLGKFEQTLKEQFGVGDSTAIGVDLVKEILVKQGKNIDIDDEKVKLHPLYRKLEVALEKDYIAKADYDKVVGEFDGYKNNIQKNEILSTVVNVDAVREFRSLNPVLSADPVRAINQENAFLNTLKTFEYEKQADGNHIIKVDGKRLENAQGHPIPFKEFIRQQAEMSFDFKVQGDKGSAGNNNNAGGAGAGKSFSFKTKEEYLKAQVSESDPQTKIAMMHAWE